jgi:N-acetylneuraminate synthase/N,N'-diacetyllegionaminate synthase
LIRFIADIGANHNQDEKRLIKMIEQAADAGCWAIKPQYYRVKDMFRGETHMKESWEFPKEFIPLAREHCKKNGLKLGVSIFHKEDFDFLKKYVDFWKISSYDILRQDLINMCVESEKPTMISIGLARKRDMTHVLSLSPQPIILHCVTKYPVPVDEANLTVLDYPFIHGYSDHTRNKGVLYRAGSKRISYIEFHQKLDGEGYESKTTEHCWDMDEIKEIISDIRDGESAYRMRGMVSDEKLKERCDPDDGKRPLQVIEGRHI